MRWAVLLKGLNIGGKRLPMPELKAFLEALGHRDVSTLLASGNAVMTAGETDGAALERALEVAATERLTLRTDWLVRSHAELTAAIESNPFPDAARDRPSGLILIFHRDVFPAERLAALDHDGPERLHAHGRELYVDYAEGVGASKLPQAMARARFGRWPPRATGTPCSSSPQRPPDAAVPPHHSPRIASIASASSISRSESPLAS